MKRAIFFLLVATSLVADPIFTPSMPAPDPSEGFRVNNAILARVNGNTISVLDVIKKMDLAFHQSYPQLIDSKEARFQFYQSGWKTILNEMIHMELILADSVAKELKLTDGEIREEIESRFGPNIMSTLDKIGLTFDEAWKLIKNEMTVQRMKWYFVNSKALQTVTPKLVRQKYLEYCDSNPAKETWQYQVISIRGDDKAKMEEFGKRLYDVLESKLPESSEMFQGLDKIAADFPECTMQLSSEYSMETQNLSVAHREVLSKLTPNSISSPIIQTSRTDNKNLSRIFYLKNHQIDKPPTFDEISSRLENELLNQVAYQESLNYMEKLKKLYGDGRDFQEKLPDDFVPFSMPQQR